MEMWGLLPSETAFGGGQKYYKKTEENTKFNELCTSLEAIKTGAAANVSISVVIYNFILFS